MPGEFEGTVGQTVIAPPEGVRVKSTGEAGGVKFLRENGDGSASWQNVSTAAIILIVLAVLASVGLMTGGGALLVPTLSGDNVFTGANQLTSNGNVYYGDGSNLTGIASDPLSLTERAAPAIAAAGFAKLYADSTSHNVKVSSNLGGFQTFVKTMNAPTVTPSATLGDHTVSGSTVTITATAHGLTVNQTVTLAGWTWTTSAINASFLVTTIPTANTFTFTLAGQSGNPTVVGTVVATPQTIIGANPPLPTPLTDALITATATKALQTNGTITATDAAGTGAGTITTVQGQPLTIAPTAFTATTGASKAGDDVNITAPPAVASTDTNGAAAGGDVNINAGAAARLVSGNAAGGNIILTPGAGIGTGAAGRVFISTSLDGTGSAVVIDNGYVGKIRLACTSTDVYVQNMASANKVVFSGNSGAALAGGIKVLGGPAEIQGTITATNAAGTGDGTIQAVAGQAVIIISALPKMENTVTSNSLSGASAEAILATDSVDVTQAAITNASANWTVAVASNVVTVQTVAVHKFSINQRITCNASYTANAFMAGITFTVLTKPTTSSFTFALTQANQAATTETNASANLTPGDILLTLSTNTTFYPTECFVWCNAGVINAQPTIRFGQTAGGAEYVAAVATSGLGAAKTRNRYTTMLTDTGSNTLSAGITAAGTATSGTPTIRFGFKGIYVRD